MGNARRMREERVSRKRLGGRDEEEGAVRMITCMVMDDTRRIRKSVA